MLPYGRKILCRSPFFEAVTALRFSPDYLTRERQEFKEEGKPQVSLPFCPCGGRRSLLRSAERNSPLRFSKKLPPVRGEPPAQFACPAQPVLKNCRPLGANTLTQVGCPGQPVLKKLPPVRGEPPARFGCPGQPVLKKTAAR